MQIEELLSTPNKNQTGSIPFQTAVSEDITTKTSKEANEPLRDIKIKQPFYHANDIKEETAAQKIESDLSHGGSAKEMKERMALAAASMTSQDFSKMEEDGLSPMDLEEDKMVTIADKIRLQLAKAGVDVSMIGGISEAAIQDAGGDGVQAVAMENAIARQKISEIDKLSEDAKRFLVREGLEPTIKNIYQASYSTSSKYDMPPREQVLDSAQINALNEQIETVIKASGIEINDTSTKMAKALLKEGIPLTSQTLSYYHALSTEDLLLSSEQIESQIREAVAEGRAPEEAYLLKGYSLTDIAVKTKDIIDTASDNDLQRLVENKKPLTAQNLAQASTYPATGSLTEETPEAISAKRLLEETRLYMSVQANITLMRQGISIQTTPLSELVDRLKMQEASMYQLLVDEPENSLAVKTQSVLFDRVDNILKTLPQMPVAALGMTVTEPKATLERIYENAQDLSAKYKQANERYETMQTEVRRDLGDSIKKAFRNIEDILSDLEVEPTESNKRAVRILGYNRLDITKENVAKMRQNDALMQRVLKNMTPAVVAKMIKEGKNPLDLSLEELNQTIEETRDKADGKYDAKEYAKFLWKADRAGDLSAEERESFIGIYRLLHQVEKSDGAVIGHLLHQGAELTMRNMMMAIRTAKNEHKETVVDDSFGFVSDYKKEDLSITQQVEMAFQTARTKDAMEASSPEGYAHVGGEDAIMAMTPDELASALEEAGIDSMQDDYEKEQFTKMQRAIQSQEQVYQVLKQYDIPVTPTNLEAMQSFYMDRNGMFKHLFDRKVFSKQTEDVDFDNIDLDAIMADIIHDFGEAVKTPTDMAKAQQKLEETAVNVMKSMMVERSVGSFDINGMRVAVTQIQMMGKISRQTENYSVPIIVADEHGTLSLKIVRGDKEDKGMVDIAFDMEKTGAVNATFRYEAQGVRGTVSCQVPQTRELIERSKELFEQTIEDATGLKAQLSFGQSESVNAMDVYRQPNAGTVEASEQSPIQTSVLYGIARSFIDTIGQISF